MEHTNGVTSFKLTPNTAGSVIPSNAERHDGNATCFVLLLVALIATANTAPACATFPQVPIGFK